MECDVQIEDLSLSGALVSLPNGVRLKPGSHCMLRVELSTDAFIEIQAVVMHVRGNYIGLQTECIDLDSLTHLRQLIETNSGNPALFEEEISFLIDL
jgi:hypothetical protein